MFKSQRNKTHQKSSNCPEFLMVFGGPRILDAVFVFGVEALNIPAMGVEGAAWSTVASIWISCLSFCVLLSQRGFVDWTAAYSWPLALKDRGWITEEPCRIM